MFLGTYAPKLDDKGRVILPAKFRDELSGGLVVTRGQEHCLYVFSQREFDEIHGKIRQASITSKQNRVTIPANLREYASLDRDLTVIGAGNRAEIWDTAAWNTYYENAESDFANTTEEVIPGLF